MPEPGIPPTPFWYLRHGETDYNALRTRETAAILNETLKLPIVHEADLREVVFGGTEGQPLRPWFADWVEGRMMPEGAETFASVTTRIAGILPRLLAHPGLILIAGHGGVFRAIRHLLGLPKEGSTPNGVPLYCTPVGAGWRITGAV